LKTAKGNSWQAEEGIRDKWFSSVIKHAISVKEAMKKRVET